MSQTGDFLPLCFTLSWICDRNLRLGRAGLLYYRSQAQMVGEPARTGFFYLGFRNFSI
jgi:hypothetical protein